ncbi:MAG TPA: C2 family cysteine protease [Tepidisphaeraceae bacterium]|nr:C2 family cysteine protease [Tepidisphaeraceae bacterium]
MTRNATITGVAVEALEGRMLLSGSPLNVSEIPFDGGVELKIIGTGGNDRIGVTQTPAGLVVSNGSWSQTFADPLKGLSIDAGAGNDSVIIDSSVHVNATVFGGSGNDTLHAGSGDDTLYAGTAGRKILMAGSGNDTLVSLGATSAVLAGGAGVDSFWADSSPKEKITGVTSMENARGCVHRVSGFINMSPAAVAKSAGGKARKAAPKSPAGMAQVLASRNISEPISEAGTHYAGYTGDPLFSDAGPSADDVLQGDVGDCYLLAVFSSVAKIDPQKIRQSILDLGDGTYAVRFEQNNHDVYVRVDSQLATWNDDNSVTYAKLGAQSSLWVALMEKAWTYVHTLAHTYDSISAGWMDEAYAALGAQPTSVYSADSAASLMSIVKQQLDAGHSVTLGTQTAPANSSILSDHAYSVDSVTLNARGDVTALRLRNPWGIDGAGNDGLDDGYVTVTPAQAYAAFAGIVYAAV